VELSCPTHHVPLTMTANSYICTTDGCRYPIVAGIPRFLPTEAYAASFGLQWRRFQRTQLDSWTGSSISRDRLTRLIGAPLSSLKGRKVLEAGCGAGRFTELLLKAGAKVFAADLSSAVEANFANCRTYDDYFVCQADILNLPVTPGQFDVVVSIGVIQHTPNPEQTIAALVDQVRAGGSLVIDHYSSDYPSNYARRILRRALVHRRPALSLRLVEILTRVLWPLHRLFYVSRDKQILKSVGGRFLRYTPIIDQQYAYPSLRPTAQLEWAILDTHDTLTDAYKHLRTMQEIEAALGRCGLENIRVSLGGNGVEARAEKPDLVALSLVS
jgi:SAM-dependent methyltransferase